MKLVSVNVEGRKHLDSVYAFLEKKDADTVCLQEAPIDISAFLKERGYRVTFLPLTLMTREGERFPQGNLFASKNKYKVDVFHYHQPSDSLPLFDKERVRETNSRGLILAQIEDFLIATTHFTWNPDEAHTSDYQVKDIRKMFDYLDKQSPHILCGDLNISRNINSLYKEELITRYSDAVPEKYKSSLDKNLHRLGNDSNYDFIFDSYMVDYLLLKPPFEAENVRLEFGVSDHAGLVADLKIVS
jgi:exonuclease III